MMKVSFAQIDEAYLRNKVENGFYNSVSEAIRDMVRKQREREQASLITALDFGEQAVRDGHVFDYSQSLFEATIHRGIESNRPQRGAKNTDDRTD